MKKLLIAAMIAGAFALPSPVQAKTLELSKFVFACINDPRSSDQIDRFKLHCDGKESCTFICNKGGMTTKQRDICPGYTKKCVVEYSCGGPSLPKVFIESGATVTLSCPRP